jgi:cytochrome c-type biogenesis protein CcmH
VPRDEAETARQATLAILRDQMAQLNADLAAGTLDAEQHRAGCAEIERRVLEETAAVEASVATATPRAGSGKPWATIVVIALAIPLLATYGYEHLGNPAAIEAPAAEAAPALADGVTNDQVEVLIKQLAERMKSNPNDLEGWTLLARTYAAMQKFPEAAQAFERATALSPNDASVLADRADLVSLAAVLPPGARVVDLDVAAAPGQKTYGGYAVGASVSYKLPMIAAGDQIWITANYANGLQAALLGNGGLSTLGGVNRMLGGVVRVDSNLVKTGGLGTTASPFTFDSTTGWNLATEFVHYWAPQWRSLVSAGYISLSPPTSSVQSTWGSGKLWEVSGNLIYSPVKDLDIGLELQYANLKNKMQNPTAAFVAAGQPGLSVNNYTVRFRAERGF